METESQGVVKLINKYVHNNPEVKLNIYKSMDALPSNLKEIIKRNFPNVGDPSKISLESMLKQGLVSRGQDNLRDLINISSENMLEPVTTSMGQPEEEDSDSGDQKSRNRKAIRSCKGTTKAGARCKRMVTSTYCYQHKPK
jgi:hypothetical protein